MVVTVWLQSLRGAAQRGKFRGIANSDVLSAFISPHCGQTPVPRSTAGNPLAFRDALNVAGIGEEADGVVNGKTTVPADRLRATW